MTTREAIKFIISNGGTVSYAYKTRILDWISEVKISIFENQAYISGANVIGALHQQPIDQGIDYFIKKIFSRQNIALVVDGIRKHKLSDLDLDDIPEKDWPALIKTYFDVYYPQDYPEFALD